MYNETYKSKIFIQTELFQSQWEKLLLSDQDLRELEFEIGNNSENHNIVEGTGGIKKFRFSPSSLKRSKSDAYRIYYLPAGKSDSQYIFLMTVYDKKEIDNLTKSQRNKLKKVVEILKESLKKK
ncbi:addiction module toxin RelE [Lysinibacillus sp. B2A1]|nr:addiction module toxin RelE [Lysinibacillus sp. B2A1]